MIDLAGSEKGSDTPNSSSGIRNEAAQINKSLLSLKECIRAMNSGHHAPFRGSKLTMILRDNLIDPDAKCVMMACLGPSYFATEATLNCLRYADRLKATSDDQDTSMVRRWSTMSMEENNDQVNADVESSEDELEPTNPHATTNSTSSWKVSAKDPVVNTQIANFAKARMQSIDGKRRKAQDSARQRVKEAAESTPYPVGDPGGEPEEGDLLSWLESKGVPSADAKQYADALCADGFDDADSVINDLTAEEMIQDYGMKKGHVRKIMRKGV